MIAMLGTTLTRAHLRAPHTLACCLAMSIAVAGCDAERSSNPLSPSIAGPLAGVTITTPAAVGPTNALLIATTEQPLTLIFASADSNSVRPFTYEVQVATDAAFTQIVVEIAGVEPNEFGQVIIQLPSSLDPDRTYYWRVRALDGANTGEYSATASFEVFTPVVIGMPAVGSPGNGDTTPSNIVTLEIVNPEIAGPAESIMYRFELATDPSFTTLAAVLTVAQAASTATAVSNAASSGGRTSASPGALPHDQTFFWRARVSAQARNGEIIGPWTPTASFTTPPPPVLIGVPTPTSPINGTIAPTLKPTLVVANGEVTGTAGTVTYQFQVDNSPAFTSPESTFSITRSGSGTSSGLVTVDLTAGTQYYWRVRGTNGTLTSSWSATATFLTAAAAPPGPSPAPPGPGPGGPRTPDPPPGGQLPLPNEAALINSIAAANPGAIANSCIEEGGSWEFMDLAVAALRARDTRWGYNCKRGNCNDPSIDVVDYFWGIGDGQQSTNVYLIDIISAVCPGGNQSPAWIDQTQATADEGTVGRWIYPR
jgi:hypothetical protein